MYPILTYLGFCKDVPTSNTEMFYNRFGINPEAARVYKEYFSSYQAGLVPLEPSILDQVANLLRNQRISTQIAGNWGKIFFGNLENTRQKLPCEPLLQSALNAQFIFEDEKLRLREIDLIQNLRHGRLAKEIDVLSRAKGLGYYFLSKEEYSYVAEIEKRAKAREVKFSRMADMCIREKRALQQDLDRRVAAIRDRWLDKPDWARIAYESQLAPHQPRVAENEDLHSSLADHCVIARGNPISEGEAIFFILKRPEEMPQEIWRRFVSKDNAFNVAQVLRTFKLNGIDPNQEFYPFSDKPFQKIAVCYEPVANTVNLHMDRDIYVKTRRRVVEKGKFERTNRPDEPKWFQDAYRNYFRDGWSENRAATAGADCYEAVSLNRMMMQMILDGKMSDIKDKVVQNLGEYFDALAGSDVARLKGSYGQNANFLQAFRMQQFLQDKARAICEHRAAISGFEQAVETGYQFKDEEGRLNLLTQDLFESYETWRLALHQFLVSLDTVENREVRDALGPALVQNLRTFDGVLTQFLAEAPHPEIRPILAARRAILNNHPLPTPQRQQLLDALWANWKQGKTKEEIDQILAASIEQVQRSLRDFNQGWIVISAPLSSPSFQAEVFRVMKPALVPIYNAALPPFFQNKARVEIFMKEILKGSDSSALWLSAADTLGMARSSLIKNELLRSRLLKLRLNIA